MVHRLMFFFCHKKKQETGLPIPCFSLHMPDLLFLANLEDIALQHQGQMMLLQDEG
jgi:hypothetical protein